MEFKWKIDLSPQTKIFSGKRDFLKGRPKFANGISEWKICAPFAIFLLVPGLLAWIAFDPTFREKVVVMKRAHLRGNFYSGFDASHLLQLSINRVNGKQPRCLLGRLPFDQKFRCEFLEIFWGEWNTDFPVGCNRVENDMTHFCSLEFFNDLEV